MGYWGYYEHYERTTPKAVKDGLKARKKVGEIGETWWAKRFLDVLGKFGWSERLARGRRYARAGQVIDYKIEYGIITSKVQGSRPKPYSIKIEVKTLSDKQWGKVIKAMSSQARFVARLLSGGMPQDIEDVFKETAIPLFPESEKDFKADCSCPDWANPCKHIAAVYYIVAEAFDRDPFLIFHLRGKKRNDLLSELHKEIGVVPGVRLEEIVQEEIAEPLSDDPAVFWRMSKEISLPPSLDTPPLNAAILHRLGVPQFWMGTEKDFYQTMEKAYKNISDSAVKIAYSSLERVKW
ncbi:MAG: SWIM zinc finger family protein [bacterium]